MVEVVQVQVRLRVEPLVVKVVVDKFVVVALVCFCTAGTCFVGGALPALMISAGAVDGAAILVVVLVFLIGQTSTGSTSLDSSSHLFVGLSVLVPVVVA